MSWWQLFKRAYAVWKLRKRTFHTCVVCSIPLTPEEAALSGQGWTGDSRWPEGRWECAEDRETRLSRTNNDLQNWGNVRGSWQQLYAPGLSALCLQQSQQQAPNPYQSALAQQVQMQQMQLQNETQEQRAQRMNLLGQLGGVLGGFRGGYGNH